MGKQQLLAEHGQAQQHDGHADLARGEHGTLVGLTPADAVEQGLCFVVQADRALCHRAGAQLAHQAAKFVFAGQLALQALVDHALAAALLQQVAGDQHDGGE
ncbi:hypothetical protein QFZ45_002035 [Pseudomonas synxantha]|nr:hypothetical protein [Pseudomonas synxantha]